MLTLPLATGLREVLFLGAHCDDVEIGCGGTLAALARACRGRLQSSCSPGAYARRRRGRRSRGCCPKERLPTRDPGSAMGSSRSSGRRSRSVSRRSRAAVAGSRLHPLRARPTPGPSDDLRADVEYISQSHRARIRDPEIRWRPRATRVFRAAAGRDRVEHKIDALLNCFASQRRQALVYARSLFAR